ncbi:hypothetical protein H4F33_08685 [Pectobacterium brasiliense]|uniref:Uncharacterized protein n=1 Tax=Pectobacterium brasiliense TaxID=180957 RepID=A0AAE2WBL2_9GAMM|nr:PAAR domain-containing protein [Pectobacterium brasiliense]MBA0218242.1 hypothetical protein [Pectobacterium brasiliense]MBN3049978.1 hypothetical protein [Pectobacterium brasiliense]MBN3072185.1 hypothetical protein [Pectobacterium brasiliense]MBN3171147.1 hypothetical protein [Pectobacterium brasiliense]
MGNAVKLGDSDTGHGSHPPTSVASGSSTVKVDGLPLARQGDPLTPHGHVHITEIGQRDPSQEQAYAFILVEKFVGYTVPDDKGSRLAPFNRHSIEGISRDISVV